MQTATLSRPRHTPERKHGLRRLCEVGLATDDERETIFELRHEVYAREIGQHAINPQARLTDALDEVNVYIVVRCAGEVAGFVSLTPPGQVTGYSIDKYFCREDLPFEVDDRLFEVRLLTVRRKHRGTRLAAEMVRQCRASNLFLRDASRMGARLGDHALRIAVKDAETNARMLAILRRAARA